jgi:hypothetical protein
VARPDAVGGAGFGVAELCVGPAPPAGPFSDGAPGFPGDGALPLAAATVAGVTFRVSGPPEVTPGDGGPGLGAVLPVLPGAGATVFEPVEAVFPVVVDPPEDALVVTVLREPGPGVTVLRAPLTGGAWPASAGPGRGVSGRVAPGLAGPGRGVSGRVAPASAGPGRGVPGRALPPSNSVGSAGAGPGFAVPGGRGTGRPASSGGGEPAMGWPSAEGRFGAGGPGLGPFRPVAGWWAAERPRCGTLMSASRAGPRP